MTGTDKDGDLLWGAREIGAAINRTERQTFYLLSQKRIPARKVGQVYVGSHAKILRALTDENGESTS
jgi:hypothetical protein